MLIGYDLIIGLDVAALSQGFKGFPRFLLIKKRECCSYMRKDIIAHTGFRKEFKADIRDHAFEIDLSHPHRVGIINTDQLSGYRQTHASGKLSFEGKIN